ncbi:Protein arginine N-methyltransferase SFM1 [Sphaceloma murrayae]|uniref:Protein arginine N-methyltransferase SFM1 n=1 Tax=Sphaceloma murrayae TaxID=2082308 RepID=A0A2K1QWU2_9PEZI|nr:Protein arginine N-methyltransferase SFM1 [Sphaceloma murrayae]
MASNERSSLSKKSFVVEHLDPELEEWSSLEYTAIARESETAGCLFYLSSVSPKLKVPSSLQNSEATRVEQRSVEEIFASAKDRVCLLDPAAKTELSPADGKDFDTFLFGGILGDDPPRDRTSELRKKGYVGRRLGPVQMTTDTAVRVTRIVILDQVPLGDIKYLDHPEIKVDEHESTEMPFRYVDDGSGQPILPQ